MNDALITGASSGIGYELAKLFAKKGNDVILVARNKEKLARLADDLQNDYKINALIIDIDLVIRMQQMKSLNRCRKNPWLSRTWLTTPVCS